MQNRWNEAAAAECSGPLELRVYTSRLLGTDPDLVLHGGGNTSVKTTVPNLFGDVEEVIYIKGSGWDLATIAAAGFAPVRLDVLRRMADLPALTDADMVRAQRAAMVDPDAPVPSIEAILHAIIPFDYVDHTHADAVVAVSNTPDGEQTIRDIYGDDVVVVPYVMPGFLLARSVRRLTRSAEWSRLKGIVLLHHGIFTFGPDAETSYGRMIELVTRAEEHLAQAGAVAAPVSAPPAVPPDRGDLLSVAQLRRTAGTAKGGPVVAHLDLSSEAAAFASRADVAEIATRGPLTPDHVIRTKPVPLVADGEWADAVRGYVDRYREYFARHATPALTALDPAPRWVVWRNRGFVTIGGSARDAGITADLARHTARAIQWAERMGGWRALPEADLFAIEYWELEQAKLKRHGAMPLLSGKVALVTGAASGIGRAVAEALHAHGAAVVAADINPAIEQLFRSDGLYGVTADVTDPAAVELAMTACVAQFGGLDILVSSAGVFPPSQSIEELQQQVWERSLALNLSSHLGVLRSAIPLLRLGFDPCVVIMGSKNVPAPGPGAAAYSVAKAGLTQLARIAALELGQHGIRVNTLHPHLVFDTALWTPEVLAARASQYGMTVEEYRRNNLLGVEIGTHDVANAVLAMVGPAFAKTTGAQLPIDGGSDRVI